MKVGSYQMQSLASKFESRLNFAFLSPHEVHTEYFWEQSFVKVVVHVIKNVWIDLMIKIYICVLCDTKSVSLQITAWTAASCSMLVNYTKLNTSNHFFLQQLALFPSVEKQVS